MVYIDILLGNHDASVWISVISGKFIMVKRKYKQYITIHQRAQSAKLYYIKRAINNIC